MTDPILNFQDYLQEMKAASGVRTADSCGLRRMRPVLSGAAASADGGELERSCVVVAKMRVANAFEAFCERRRG
jgi:hypothetical protein